MKVVRLTALAAIALALLDAPLVAGTQRAGKVYQIALTTIDALAKALGSPVTALLE